MKKIIDWFSPRIRPAVRGIVSAKTREVRKGIDDFLASLPNDAARLMWRRRMRKGLTISESHFIRERIETLNGGV